MGKLIRNIDNEVNPKNRKYFAEYTLTENGEIFLTDASRLYINTHHYPTDCIGRCITEFTDSAFRHQLNCYIENSKVYKKIFSFFEEDESRSLMNMRKIMVTVEKPKITFVGEAVSIGELSVRQSYANIKMGGKTQNYIFDLNSEFAELLKERKISLNTLTSSLAFRQSLTTMSLYSENVSYQLCRNIYEYQLTAVPVIKNGNIIFVMIFLEKTGSFNIIAALETLTSREKEIIRFTAHGYTNKYIAYSLNIKEGTVKKSLHNCYKKLSVSSRAEIIKIFYQANESDFIS